MDISALTLTEVEALISEAQQRVDQLRLAEFNEQLARTARIGSAITALETVLGPVGAEPGTDSIRAVLRYDGPTMVEHAAIALPLIVHGLEIVTSAALDMALTIEKG